jgi:calcineurin-like phosphoesterase family protein
MNHTIVNNWNSVILPNDRVYHLGDFAMGNKSHWSRFCKALNGYKILVRGNHDKGKEFMLSVGFDEVYDNLMYGDPYDPFKLIHDPIGMTGTVLCGHVHTSWKRIKNTDKDIINVGVDQWDFVPKTLNQLLEAKAHEGPEISIKNYL